MSGDDYDVYLRSARWRELRAAALARDNYRCRGCGTSEHLEVHHLRYPEVLGSESVDDLTTLCGGPDGCHAAVQEAAARREHKKRELEAGQRERVGPGHLRAAGAVSTAAVSAHRRIAAGHAQRAAGGPAERLREGDEDNHAKADEDGG